VTLHPLGDDVLVEFHRPKQGIIAAPDSAEQKPTVGVVKAIGPKHETFSDGPFAGTLKHGDTVLVDLFKGRNIKLEGWPKQRMMKANEVLAVITSTFNELESGEIVTSAPAHA
jgi:co-chaperonin GroES (HSP10)